MPIEGVPECQLKASQNGKSSHQNWMFVDRRGGRDRGPNFRLFC